MSVITSLRRAVPWPTPTSADVNTLARALAKSRRPVFVLGSQCVRPQLVQQVVTAVSALQVPVYLSGMARGLLVRARSYSTLGSHTTGSESPAAHATQTLHCFEESRRCHPGR